MSAPGAIRCVAFDFDGTLADSNGLKREAWFTVFAGLGCPRAETAALLADHPLADRFELAERMLARRGEAPTPARIADLAARYNAICEEGQGACPEMPGADAMLAALAPRLPLYVNSATPEEPLGRIVRRRGWAGYFRGIYGRPHGKVENLRRIAAAESLALAQIALVGDGLADVEAARETGCPFFAVGELLAAPLPLGTAVPHLRDLPARLLS